jgi:sec-independent protein translocase protein TatA
MGELIVILLILLLVFGASRLPQIGEGLGKAIKGLKRGLSADDDIEVTPNDKRVSARSSAEDVPAPDVSDAEISSHRKS